MTTPQQRALDPDDHDFVPFTQAEAFYKAEPGPLLRTIYPCRTCRWFVFAPEETEKSANARTLVGTCKVVGGAIEATGTSALWQKQQLTQGTPRRRLLQHTVQLRQRLGRLPTASDTHGEVVPRPAEGIRRTINTP